MSQVITDAFSSYWQQCLIDQTPVILDEFVLAHIPGLDQDAPIDPASGLPPTDQIVHRHAVDQRGRINNDAVAYSIVMDTTVGDFTFNAMYLINTALNLVGMIVHKGEETKLKTDPALGQTGNSLVKSMLMEYDRAAEASQTVIDASTWQIDYAARLQGMDEDLRRQAMGTFGHTAFYGDGFKLLNDAGLYKVQPGLGYVGGLLVELTAEQEVVPGAKPVGLWLDVYRAGSLLSPWVNHVTLTLSTTDLVDYVDANGYPHYVTKLAVINGDDSVTDTRAKRTITLSGDVTGQAVLEGPDSVQINVTVQDNSHAHTIDNVTGLQGELDGKSPTGHTHGWEEVTEKPVDYPPSAHTHAAADVPGMLELIFPVGSTVFRLDAQSPATLGYPGTWIKLAADLSLHTAADDGSDVGTTTGGNYPVVPVPLHTHGNDAHAHSTNNHVHPAWQDPHLHGMTLSLQDGAGAAGHVGFQNGDSNPAGSTTQYTDTQTPLIGVGEANVTVNGTGIVIHNAGTDGATIDVRGARILGHLWHRTA